MEENLHPCYKSCLEGALKNEVRTIDRNTFNDIVYK
jgi:hypothetical protein